MMRMALLAAVSAIGLSSPAMAAYHFSLSQDDTGAFTTFDVANPAEVVENTDTTTTYSVYTTFNDGGGGINAAMLDAAVFGTLDAPFQFTLGRIGLHGSQQYFTGPTDAPTGFTLGTFGLNADDDTRYSLTITSDATAAVPEPATWAMMLLGFGALGYAMRRPAKTVRVRFA